MILEIQNKSIISQASIEVKGLTVITGLNDIGKTLLTNEIYLHSLENPEFFGSSVYLNYIDIKSLKLKTYQLDDCMISITSQISRIIQGEFFYSCENGLVFKPFNSTNSIKYWNVSKGIKAFGAVQLLILTGNIMKNSLLIIDDVESHLHPQWQKEYAKIIIKLIETDVHIVVTSHSPYMLKALQVYANRSKIADKAKFYFGELTNKGSVFKDCTDNLGEILHPMSRAMQQIAFED